MWETVYQPSRAKIVQFFKEHSKYFEQLTKQKEVHKFKETQKITEMKDVVCTVKTEFGKFKNNQKRCTGQGFTAVLLNAA